MNWDGRVIYTRYLADDFSRILFRRRRVVNVRGIVRVLH
jgi:hypothetical protein